MAQGGTADVGRETPAMDASQVIFGAGNLEYQMEEFIKSGGHSVKILLSGKTGVGKSHLTNALIGQELAEEGWDIDPQTDKVRSENASSRQIVKKEIWSCVYAKTVDSVDGAR